MSANQIALRSLGGANGAQNLAKNPLNICNGGGGGGGVLCTKDEIKGLIPSVKQCVHAAGQSNPESFESVLAFFF